MSFPTRDHQSGDMNSVELALTRTNDAYPCPGRARVDVVGHRAVYKGRTLLDTTSCRRHASRGLVRCGNTIWSNTDRRSNPVVHA
jgi:hypothetical protein